MRSRWVRVYRGQKPHLDQIIRDEVGEVRPWRWYCRRCPTGGGAIRHHHASSWEVAWVAAEAHASLHRFGDSVGMAVKNANSW